MEDTVHMSACNGDLESIQSLVQALEHEAGQQTNPDAPKAAELLGLMVDDDQRTAFHWSCTSGNLELVKLLMSQAAVNQADEDGMTPLHSAASSGHEEIVQYLLENGARGDQRNNMGAVPLHYHKGSERIAKLLIPGIDNLNIQDRNGITPLARSAAVGSQAVCDLLIANGADPNLVDKEGNTALHLACTHQHEELALFLVQNGALKDKRNKEGKLPAECGVVKSMAMPIIPGSE